VYDHCNKTMEEIAVPSSKSGDDWTKQGLLRQVDAWGRTQQRPWRIWLWRWSCKFGRWHGA